MKILKTTWQHRRDFTAVYECEHCGHTHSGSGYDDSNFHKNVIPDMKCPSCGKSGDKASYQELATKYPDSQTV